MEDAIDATVVGGDDLSAVANQYGLVIYQAAAASSGEITPLSDTSGISMPVPSVVWDYHISEWDVSGSMQWTNATMIKNDFSSLTSRVGYQDAFGLEFSNISNPGQILSWRATAYDATGTTQWQSTVPSWRPQSGSKYAVVFQGQDYALTDPAIYSWWGVIEHVWFSNSWNDTGYVNSAYGHDWQNTGLSSVDFTVGGTGSWTVTGGLTFHFTTTSYGWAGASLNASY
ncbi:MAG: hypothetical protein ACYC5Y_01640 [Symbiobacteriia bacterium]